jgi:DNA polymerase
LVAGEGDPTAERGQRWLLLAEGRPEELSEGAGQLLRNMLRAARLHQGAQVWLAPLQRSPGPAQVQGLDEVLARTEPDVVFVMSRLGAQALLETDQPLGRLRGQVHDLWGMPAVVSYDLGALMRTPMEKAKAWDDLCLALQVAQAQHAERLDAE